MECFSEVTYAILVDGELPPEESRRVQMHLASCADCRAIVAALTAENAAIVAALSQPAAAELAPTTPATHPAWLELLLLGAVLALVGVVVHWLNIQNLLGAMNWLNPFTSEGQGNVAFNLMFYLSQEGGTILEQLISVVLWSLLAIATAAGLLALARHRRLRSRLSLVALVLTFSLPGMAIETRTSNAVLTIRQNETVNDTLFARAETVEIEGVVNGDLFAAARSVVVHGTVTGNIFSWSRNVDVDGKVGGSILGCAQSVIVRGQVGHSIYSWAEFLRLEPDSQIASDLVVGSQQADLLGKIDGGVLAFASSVNVHGNIGRNILARVGEMNLNSPTHVGGSLAVSVRDRKHVRIADGVTIAGPTEIKVRSRVSRFLRPSFYIWRVIGLIAGFVVGWVVIYLFPAFFQTTSRAVGSGWRSFGLGFAILVGTPVAIVLVALSLIGLPLALITLALYLIGLYLAIVFVGGFLGSLIFKSAQPPTGRALLAYFVGLLILTVFFQLPFGLGAILKFLAFCLGLGSLTWQLYRTWRPAHL